VQKWGFFLVKMKGEDQIKEVFDKPVIKADFLFFVG